MHKKSPWKQMMVVLAAAVLASGCALLAGSRVSANQAAPAGLNLYQDVMSHRAAMTWQSSPDDNYPDDACNVINACSSDRSAPKVSLLPVATIDGHRIARAVYLVKSKDPKQPEKVVFEHQSASQTYFFLIAPNGTIAGIAYLERGSNWFLIANQLGQPIYNKDAADWHAALSKSGAAASKSGH
jgi:hypothetical protein